MSDEVTDTYPKDGLLPFVENGFSTGAGVGAAALLVEALKQLSSYYQNQIIDIQSRLTLLQNPNSEFFNALTGCEHAIDAVGHNVISNNCVLTPIVADLEQQLSLLLQSVEQISFELGDLTPVLGMGALWLINWMGNFAWSVDKPASMRRFIQLLSFLQATGSMITIGHLYNWTKLSELARQDLNNPLLNTIAIATLVLSIVPSFKFAELLLVYLEPEKNLPPLVSGVNDVIRSAMLGVGGLAGNVTRKTVSAAAKVVGGLRH